MPEISVILPVYNAAAYLKEAVDSVLAQTFTDFELIIVNDGSSDGSASIISAYTDSRIRYLENEKNSGLIYSLNRAVDAAEGKYIARMDADDSCFSNRLQAQKDWLDNHPETQVVASFSEIIDGEGRPLGFFQADRQTITAAQIRKRMPAENCVTHPSVMVRAKTLKQYRYNPLQKNIEDYDLWLRILADGGVIEKIAEPLLKYRVHPDSVTQSKLRQRNFFWKHVDCKKKFLAQRLKKGRLNRFDLAVSAQLGLDLVKAVGKDLKKYWETKK